MTQRCTEHERFQAMETRLEIQKNLGFQKRRTKNSRCFSYKGWFGCIWHSRWMFQTIWQTLRNVASVIFSMTLCERVFRLKKSPFRRYAPCNAMFWFSKVIEEEVSLTLHLWCDRVIDSIFAFICIRVLKMCMRKTASLGQSKAME